MKIGVFGGGLIGCYITAHLAHSAIPTVLVARNYAVNDIKQHGITARDISGGKFHCHPSDLELASEAEALKECGFVLLCVKSQHTGSAMEQLRPHLNAAAAVVSLQNGVRNLKSIQDFIGNRVIAGMVPYNVIRAEDGSFCQVTAGTLALADDLPKARDLIRLLRSCQLAVDLVRDIQSVQWSKLVLNLNNSVNALSRQPLRTMLLNPNYRRVLAIVQQEALGVLKTAGIRCTAIGKLYPPMLPALLRLPTPLFRMIAKASLNVQPTATSSMQEDLKAGKPTEIDYINGEVIKLATQLDIATPANTLLVKLIRAAENQGAGFQSLSGTELFHRIRNLQV